MKILGSWPACGMRYSRNVSGALGYGSALIRVTSRKLNFVPPPPPTPAYLFLWLRRLTLAKVKHFIAQAAAALVSPCQAFVAERDKGETTFSLHVCVSSSQDCLLLLCLLSREQGLFLLLTVFQETIVQLVLGFC